MHGDPRQVCDNGAMPRSRATRVARAAVASAIATFVALLSHVAAGGTMPGLLGVGVPWVLSLAVCTMLAGRSLSLLRLSIAVVVSQSLFHVLFVLGAAPEPSTAIPTGHVHEVVLPAMLASTPAAMDAAMLLSHVAAAAVTVLALYRGERTVGALLALAAHYRAWLRRQASVADGSLVWGIHPPRTAPAHTARRLSSWLLQSAIRRRGPPVVSVV